MGDFPTSTGPHKPVLSCLSMEAIGWMYDVQPSGSSAAWTSPNRAYFVPLTIRSPYLVRRLWWCNGSGTIAGTVDVGIYRPGTPRLIVSAGSTTQATTSVIQSVALGTPFLLMPGVYYMAMSSSSNTATFFHFAPTASTIGLNEVGMAQVASSHPLPATVTLATMTDNHLPFFGIASAAVI